MLPFTRDQFFEVFAVYNAASWPAAVAAYPLALIAIFVIGFGAPAARKWAGAVLAIMWAWVGVFYHAIQFSQVNAAAPAFAAAFLVQSLLFLIAAVAGRGLQFGSARPVRTWAAGILIGYAMVAYPLIGLLAGERYPAMPLFGTAPCPLLIFTFGILVLARHASWWLWVVPLLWSVIGGSAALLLSVPQDWALPVAAMVAALISAAGPSVAAHVPDHLEADASVKR